MENAIKKPKRKLNQVGLELNFKDEFNLSTQILGPMGGTETMKAL